jgi:hypothetical protein
MNHLRCVGERFVRDIGGQEMAGAAVQEAFSFA